MIKLKRIYDASEPSEGYRILVDRIWPRGVSKEKARIDLWMKDVAPSDQLRKWFGHDPKRWLEFRRRYREELRKESGLSFQPEMSGTTRQSLCVHFSRGTATPAARISTGPF
jgi:uncharacterized protein YeaO (DUF488 family)